MGCIWSCLDAKDPLDYTANVNNDHDDNIDNANNNNGDNTINANDDNEFNPNLSKKELELPYLYGHIEEECPTCLEEYTPDNPKITTKCNHQFHLACIYEWMERSTTCPICSKVMSFNDL